MSNRTEKLLNRVSNAAAIFSVDYFQNDIKPIDYGLDSVLRPILEETINPLEDENNILRSTLSELHLSTQALLAWRYAGKLVAHADGCRQQITVVESALLESKKALELNYVTDEKTKGV